MIKSMLIGRTSGSGYIVMDGWWIGASHLHGTGDGFGQRFAWQSIVAHLISLSARIDIQNAEAAEAAVTFRRFRRSAIPRSNARAN
jgi:hypothetical protein